MAETPDRKDSPDLSSIKFEHDLKEPYKLVKPDRFIRWGSSDGEGLVLLENQKCASYIPVPVTKFEFNILNGALCAVAGGTRNAFSGEARKVYRNLTDGGVSVMCMEVREFEAITHRFHVLFTLRKGNVEKCTYVPFVLGLEIATTLGLRIYVRKHVIAQLDGSDFLAGAVASLGKWAWGA